MNRREPNKTMTKMKTVQWMYQNDLVWCKSKSGGGTTYNVFDCRESGNIRFIASFSSFAAMLDHFEAKIPW